MSIINGHCTNPTQVSVTKSTCCCNMNYGDKLIGWGPNCEVFTIKNTYHIQFFAKFIE